jgi:hypothetical protein
MRSNRLTSFVLTSAILGALFPLVPEMLNAETEAKATLAKKATPVGVIKGKVESMRGHSFGYIPPKVGDAFELDLRPENQSHPKLTFAGNAYIPFPNASGEVDVERIDKGDPNQWTSLRAVYKNETGTHKVTLDVNRHPGHGHPDYVVVWILIENNDRIMGVAELHGLAPAAKK